MVEEGKWHILWIGQAWIELWGEIESREHETETENGFGRREEWIYREYILGRRFAEGRRAVTREKDGNKLETGLMRFEGLKRGSGTIKKRRECLLFGMYVHESIYGPLPRWLRDSLIARHTATERHYTEQGLPMANYYSGKKFPSGSQGLVLSLKKHTYRSLF